MDPNLYNAYYYAHECGRPYRRDEEWLRFFGRIADRIVSDINPTTALDAGCALGFLVEALRKRRVLAFGIDVSEFAIQNVFEDIRPYCWVGSVAEPFPQKYDLIVCIEVLEHLPLPEAERAAANFCQHSDDILFSSTPFDYKEATHVNVQAPEYWGELFARHGFFRDVDFDASFVTPWAARFRRRKDPLHRLAREYERKIWLLEKEKTDLRASTLELRNQLAAGPDEAMAQALIAAKQTLAEKDAEITRLQEMVAAYERGRFVRLMRRLSEWRAKLAPR